MDNINEFLQNLEYQVVAEIEILNENRMAELELITGDIGLN